MTESPVRATSQAAFAVAGPRSRAPVIIAAIVILLAALLGLYRGVVSVRAPLPGQKAASATDTIANATPAVALPHNPDWSTLSGPKILPPVVAKAKSDDEVDSADADDQPSQAAQAADPALDTPAVSPAAPVKVAPTQAPPTNLSSVAPY